MNPDAQRIAIAEACGWKRETQNMYAGTPNVRGWGFNTHLGRGDAERKFVTSSSSFPDYLNDLNACHEMEKVMSQQQKTAYIYHLQTLVGGQRFGDNYFATAAQRCEAFLKTLGLWK